MIRWTSFSQASSDGKTLSAFHVNFLSSLLRRGTVFGISFSISLNSRKLQTYEQLPPFHSILPSRYFPPKRLIKNLLGLFENHLGREKQILAPESGFGSTQIRPP